SSHQPPQPVAPLHSPYPPLPALQLSLEGHAATLRNSRPRQPHWQQRTPPRPPTHIPVPTRPAVASTALLQPPNTLTRFAAPALPRAHGPSLGAQPEAGIARAGPSMAAAGAAAVGALSKARGSLDRAGSERPPTASPWLTSTVNVTCGPPGRPPGRPPPTPDSASQSEPAAPPEFASAPLHLHPGQHLSPAPWPCRRIWRCRPGSGCHR
ncbi:hypothetical protein Vretifemale_18638, partial [Volvox reticuliferus]